MPFNLVFNKSGTFKLGSCIHRCSHTAASSPKSFPSPHSSSIVSCPHDIFFHLHIHSWNNLDTFCSPHALKKKTTYRFPSMHLSPHPHESTVTHHFLQLSYPVFVLIHCFSPLLTWLFHFLTISPLLLLFSSLLFLLCPFHFCFFINLS